MDQDEFIEQVRIRARLSSRSEAERAIAAALETLGEAMANSAAMSLASKLPGEVGDHLRRTAADPEVPRIPIEQFFARVAEREGVPRHAAITHSTAVLKVAGEARRSAPTYVPAESGLSFANLFSGFFGAAARSA